jgi:hypothetical protein
MQCPFCHEEKNQEAAVCPNCSRDTAIPKALIVERDELRQKKIDLREKLDVARARLASRRARLSRSRSA